MYIISPLHHHQQTAHLATVQVLFCNNDHLFSPTGMYPILRDDNRPYPTPPHHYLELDVATVLGRLSVHCSTTTLASPPKRSLFSKEPLIYPRNWSYAFRLLRNRKASVSLGPSDKRMHHSLKTENGKRKPENGRANSGEVVERAL